MNCLPGELRTARGLVDRLPASLEVPAEVVTEAVAETARQMRAAEDAAWRAAFKPHAIILTEHTRPTQITMAAICGADRRLRIEFKSGSSSITYVRQALEETRRRSSSGAIMFYGRPTGIIVNYSPDAAVRFDLEGNAVEGLPSAYRLGQLMVSIGGRPIPPAALDAMFGGGK